MTQLVADIVIAIELFVLIVAVAYYIGHRHGVDALAREIDKNSRRGAP